MDVVCRLIVLSSVVYFGSQTLAMSGDGRLSCSGARLLPEDDMGNPYVDIGGHKRVTVRARLGAMYLFQT